jgi:hypothetical protein
MSFSYTIDASRGLVVFQPTALPTLAELEQVLDRLLADPAFRPGYGVLVDRRNLTTEPDAEYARQGILAIASRRARFGDTRWASLTSHLATYGIGRIAEAYADNRDLPYRVFTHEGEALAWLLEPLQGESGPRPL